MVLGPQFQDADEAPGYRALEDARDEILASLVDQRAEGLAGLQATAGALLTRPIMEAYEDTGAIAHSLARDLVEGDMHLDHFERDAHSADTIGSLNINSYPLVRDILTCWAEWAAMGGVNDTGADTEP